MQSLESPADCKLCLFDGLSGVVEGRLSQVIQRQLIRERRLEERGRKGERERDLINFEDVFAHSFCQNQGKFSFSVNSRWIL